MYLFATDETNLEPSKDGIFFIYGGLVLRVDQLVELHDKISDIRSRYHFNPGDRLKFDTRARPSHIDQQAYTQAKEEVITACHAIGARFIAHLVLHDIAKSQTKDELIEWALSTVLLSFNNKFLREEKSHGVVVVDRLPKNAAYDIIRNKFQNGLNFEATHSVSPLERIVMFAVTCDGASHISSAVDITLGAFRYVVNSRDKNDRNSISRTLYSKVARIMYAKSENGRLRAGNYGFILRPRTVNHPPYRAEYARLIDYLGSLLPANFSQD